jgi:hypothetical protein
MSESFTSRSTRLSPPIKGFVWPFPDVVDIGKKRHLEPPPLG